MTAIFYFFILYIYQQFIKTIQCLLTTNLKNLFVYIIRYQHRVYRYNKTQDIITIVFID